MAARPTRQMATRSTTQMATRVTRQQSKQDQSRAKWTASLTETLADLMVDQVIKGNRRNNSFGKKAWKSICDEFHKKTGLKWDKEQLKNRYGALRKQYVIVKPLLDQSDFSWDESQHMVIANDEVWDKYIEEHPDAETIRSNGCPLYRQLLIIFSESGANGLDETANLSVDPGATPMVEQEVSSSQSDEDEDISYGQNKRQSRPTPRAGRPTRNRRRVDDVMVEAMFEMASASRLRAAVVAQSSEQFSITNCIKGLDELQGVDDSIYFAALNLFDNANAREIFISLRSDLRLTWLKGKCNPPSGSLV